ncbi:hypothetical protein [Algoriphagus chordae]|uniref:Four-helix bundle copper-binding protein n=1 Tax=Algoriphagus chordae TaxID=237019 RepID=A0A2W7R0J0_9BACT|nr:hypothetical protein [Algoriphagus chordae]PZX54044.1 hypothetical protein LV85_01383 [Algoriphagus chordae]
MKALTSSSSNYRDILEQCIKDCQILIETQKQIPGRERCIELSNLCIGACNDCLVACESVGEGIGKMMQSCVDACIACAAECKRLASMKDKEARVHAPYPSLGH